VRVPGIAGIGKDPRNGDVLMANLAQGKVLRLAASGGVKQ